ncbi:MAG: ATP synthase F1 subunit epsilon [Atopobiaceae bacterium]|jgi:F-type H+-transporting ATPase subunit epsilon|nr:ATP synthase F1 subunit epsilon [Atopobiaceae bacterium]MCI2173552.1 ATP synthase F1 subunit epsilon [Atopobiaceae bacterium]MCI2207806.1 ATP synthase F1 subunit epsilon [Atopobiaceae bacterium]
MDTLTCRIVRPDKQLYEGAAESMTLVTRTGELGVLPKHSAEICALGDGVMRVKRSADEGGETERVVISGGYAEISDNTVIVLADHARNIDDIDADRVSEVRAEAVSNRDAIPEGDHARAYYEGKIHWCDLLLKEATEA